MAFFFPLCLRSARQTLSGCLGSSSLLSSSTFIITCRDTRACSALWITTQKTAIIIQLNRKIYWFTNLNLSQIIHTYETAGAYHEAERTSWIPPDRPGLLCDSCLDSHTLQTKQCRKMLVWLLFPAPAYICKCPRAPGSSLPNDTQYTHTVNVILATFICQNSTVSQRWKCTYKFIPQIHITGITVIFLFLCEPGHNPFQQRG